MHSVFVDIVNLEMVFVDIVNCALGNCGLAVGTEQVRWPLGVRYLGTKWALDTMTLYMPGHGQRFFFPARWRTQGGRAPSAR